MITGPSCSGKSVFLTKLILIILNEYHKIYIYSPNLHQGLYENLIKCFSKYIPTNILPNVLNEEDIELVIEEIVNNRDFQKSDAELGTYVSKEELKYPQEFEDGSIYILDDLNEKEMNGLVFKQFETI